MNAPSLTKSLGQTPMTDPRSLGVSVIVHALLILAVSAMVFAAPRPSEPEASKAILGELDPVDNRAKGSGGEGGGSPGELGNDRLATVASPSGESGKAAASRDPSADALLSEI